TITTKALQYFHLTVRDPEGNPIESGIGYTVYTAGSTTAATIYSDEAETAKTNPVTTTVFATDKEIKFWLNAASCDILLDLANGQRVFLDGITAAKEHNAIIPDQEQQQAVKVGKIFEFDCAETAVTNVIIPALANPRGIIITHVFGIVTEAMVGSSQDQGIVTVSDESDNSICTLTPTDAAADAIGDYILGFQAQSTATGTAGKSVAAGEYVDAVVTQATAGGTPAGKYKVYVEYIQL
ncbi:hypothetical protein KKF61_09220, partial [Patescibacteria group bacterium]|nr:hypothetical protein [Patescibacteria group bacterium]